MTEGQEIYSQAVIPARPASPPPPPPPASGRMPDDDARYEEFRRRWETERHGQTYALPVQRSTVDVTGATEALVVGPHDVLIIAFNDGTTMDELYQVRERLRDSDLRDGQIMLIAGAEKIVKVQQDEPRTYPRPQVKTIDGG